MGQQGYRLKSSTDDELCGKGLDLGPSPREWLSDRWGGRRLRVRTISWTPRSRMREGYATVMRCGLHQIVRGFLDSSLVWLSRLIELKN